MLMRLHYGPGGGPLHTLLAWELLNGTQHRKTRGWGGSPSPVSSRPSSWIRGICLHAHFKARTTATVNICWFTLQRKPPWRQLRLLCLYRLISFPQNLTCFYAGAHWKPQSHFGRAVTSCTEAPRVQTFGMAHPWLGLFLSNSIMAAVV